MGPTGALEVGSSGKSVLEPFFVTRKLPNEEARCEASPPVLPMGTSLLFTPKSSSMALRACEPPAVPRASALRPTSLAVNIPGVLALDPKCLCFGLNLKLMDGDTSGEGCADAGDIGRGANTAASGAAAFSCFCDTLSGPSAGLVTLGSSIGTAKESDWHVFSEQPIGDGALTGSSGAARKVLAGGALWSSPCTSLALVKAADKRPSLAAASMMLRHWVRNLLAFCAASFWAIICFTFCIAVAILPSPLALLSTERTSSRNCLFLRLSMWRSSSGCPFRV
mmetsp:Transcript_56638/g.132909  ORF Transcript_56638/g.132909 Transcript_56638/m.132909 type:complete len:280 (-) Transcript_56638:1868-2707(-)